MEQSLSRKRDEMISLLPWIRNPPELQRNQPPVNIASSSFAINLTMTLTGLPPAYKKENTPWFEGTTYQITPFGIRESARFCQDGNVVFGKADPSGRFFCDVNFPQEDTKIDPISCIIFSVPNGFRLSERPYYYVNWIDFGRIRISEPGYYYIDFSKSGNTGVKLSEGDKILLKKGMMIRFANSIIVEVSDISCIEIDDLSQPYLPVNSSPDEVRNNQQWVNQPTYTGEEGEEEEKKGSTMTDYTISFTNHTGPFVGETFKYHSNPKAGVVYDKLIIGCGGNGKEPDVFYPRDTGISRHHATVFLENGSWYLTDNQSVNLTYILAKNAEQYTNKEPSTPQPLFLPKDPQHSYENTSVLGIENYKFFFSFSS
ncbi:unnamed protein product [Blepharisma stoltei]|uniref:FHA domain-containing protein n=1 Tax=Blepharisma stoltei TaxID=1481888 RepID=A0AAU9KIW9_9CILI|nr:unnamed protein product [Blepharisma stoltei]